VREDQPVTDVLTLFSERGFHHVPVVDQSNRLVGIISEHDLVLLLELALQPGNVNP